jgi:hypothetical protein
MKITAKSKRMAKGNHVPRTTLQHWLIRKDTIGAPPGKSGAVAS